MAMLFVMYQNNQQSMNLKYEVWGNVKFSDASNDTSTKRNVIDPMNLLLKFEMLMKSVR